MTAVIVGAVAVVALFSLLALMRYQVTLFKIVSWSREVRREEIERERASESCSLLSLFGAKSIGAKTTQVELQAKHLLTSTAVVKPKTNK